MTEKRFSDGKAIIDMLNELSDENEQLKQQREELFIRERDTKNELRELKQENEQLKIKNQKQENLINSQNKVIEELENWFDKWGFDVVNYRILDEIMEHFLEVDVE